jgi:ubiquinone/menaquinone biosynthesis C-methylase UbiE
VITTEQTRDTKAHFDRISGQWSRNYDARSGAMRRRIDDFRQRLAPEVPPSARLLDFGCGSGDITRALAGDGFEMTGIDLSLAMIEVARRTPAPAPIEWRVAVPGQVNLPFANCVFDGALASSVLEYHPDCAGQLRELCRVIKPGGIFAFTVPDLSHPERGREKFWKLLADGPLWPLLRRSRFHDYFEYLRVSNNRWPVDAWLALVTEAGFQPELPVSRGKILVMILCRKPA